MFVVFGIEKSFIWLLRMMPVVGSIRREPKKMLTVEVREKARPLESAVAMWDVPWLRDCQ